MIFMCRTSAIIKRLLFGAFLLSFASLLVPSALRAEEKPIPRVLVALYDSRIESNPRYTTLHRYLTLPANHLGYDIALHDILSPLPKLGDDVAGIVLWFDSGTEVPDIYSYLTWVNNAAKQGKKIILLENPGFDPTHIKDPRIAQMWNYILAYIGIQDDANWIQLTYNTEISSIDREMVGFERQIKPPYPEISGFHTLAGSHSTSHLRMHVSDNMDNHNFDMVVTSPHGGFVAPGYSIFEQAKTVTQHIKSEKDKEGRAVKKQQVTQEWIINPFVFLKQALGNTRMPVPDTTTLDGKRIFYAHIDGDGWNSISEIDRYHTDNIISSDVIYRELLKPYTDFAFTVGLVGEEVDPHCFAVPDSEKVAREIFALPNIEPSSHTYSHPLFWQFFAHYTPDKEQPLLKYYPPRPEEKFSAVEMFKRKMLGSNTSWSDKAFEIPRQNAGDEESKNASSPNAKHWHAKTEEQILRENGYVTPRSYSCTPFRLEDEIIKSTNIVKKLSPPGKAVRLIQWSGDTSPFEAALKMARETGLLNINGGDSRFDGEFPSYSFVAPIGINIGNERQIFSSNSNEETYTDDWTDRFYGYVYLKSTAIKTDKPIRVSPFNVYFHMFSGEKEASLNAVKDNLNYARTQDIIPITASDYASIAEGFYSSEIVPEGNNAWIIRNRGDLETVRFDNAENMNVIIEGSRGVLGQNHYNGSLYVALDPAVKDAYVKVASGYNKYGSLQLVQSRWRVSDLHRNGSGAVFNASGYGNSDMVWQGIPGMGYTVIANDHGKSSSRHVTADSRGLISISIKSTAIDGPVAFSVHPAVKIVNRIGNISEGTEKKRENTPMKELNIKTIEETAKSQKESQPKPVTN